MLDIQLDRNGDIEVTSKGDVLVTNSIRQSIMIRLKWIYNEWRLGPELGFPWFEKILVKNPDNAIIRQIIRSEIMKVDRVQDARVISFDFDRKSRKVRIAYQITVARETFREEVAFNA